MCSTRIVKVLSAPLWSRLFLRRQKYVWYSFNKRYSRELSSLSAEGAENSNLERDINKLRNVGISAHIDSGKTTLTERVLFYSGRIREIHEVKGKDGKGATMDFMELERERGITIQSAATSCFWANHPINIIDTPGHVDFTIEVERALRVLDGAVLVLCAVGGVQSQSLTVSRQMNRYKVPRIAFINKLDRQGANPFRVVQQLRDKLHKWAAPLVIPIGLEEELKGVVDIIRREALYFEGRFGEQVVRKQVPEALVHDVEKYRKSLVEMIAELDEYIADKFLSEQEISEEELTGAIRKVTVNLQFIPVFMGSALKNCGVQPLLDGVVQYLPNPKEKENIALRLVRKEVDGEMKQLEEPVVLSPSADEKLVCLAFKLEDGRYGQLTYLRLYQGTLKRGDYIFNSRTSKKVKVPRLVRMHADEMEEISEAVAGDICAVFGVECASGDTFTDGKDTFSMESVFIPEPVMSLAVKPKSRETSNNFTKALARFMREDPTFHFFNDSETKQLIISGMGELHLQVYLERMKREYGVECEAGQPQVNFRETVTKRTKFDYLHKKQTGGAGQYGGVIGYIEPSDDSLNNEFVNRVVGNAIPPNLIPAVEAGFREACERGSLTGHRVQGVRMVLEDGKSHSVDSSELAFRIAAIMAFREAFPRAEPAILEPVMTVEVQVPTEFQGTVMGALNRRRGIIISAVDYGELSVIQAEVPLYEMFGYATELRSMTQGKGDYTMEYKEHRETTRQIQQMLVEKHQKEQAERK
ncbi:elongation factor EF-G [Galdieria sulphuraria]|uniref:Elongation factor G, mitochondrial n=1 Tax=Galdieria sulphuraria TaxID=130081 RepID=M2W970_GALSU|nr:elongation factor EF-G [Galdieria sulphuraria]EME32406.1 elongation factor EF-G [Galdieria sulphuraria]|eukprot:XP_005708926.1 elongation factor EF-G [Galdieria sulphuraria]